MSFLLGIIYLSFISLGLPDALLGAAWPNMYPEFQVPVSYAGAISMIIAFGTIISSLQSDRLTRKFGTGKVTAVSVGMTAVALWGFSISHSFVLLCLWAIPYGLGAGYHFDRHYSDAASFGKNSIADRKPYINQAVAGAFIPFPGTYGIYA